MATPTEPPRHSLRRAVSVALLVLGPLLGGVLGGIQYGAVGAALFGLLGFIGALMLLNPMTALELLLGLFGK